MHRIAFVICAAATMATATAGPRAGLIDPTFGNMQGIATHGFDLVDKGSDVATAFAEDAQGRLYLAGTVEDGDGAPCLGVMRFSPDGLLDTVYASGGTACVSIPALQGMNLLEVHDSLVQDNGDFLVAGATGSSYNATNPFVCRLTGSGTLDSSFNSSGTPGCHIAPQISRVLEGNSSVHIASTGDFTLIVANEVDEQISIRPTIYRLGTDGTLVPFGALDVVKPFATHPDYSTIIFDIAESSTNTVILAGTDSEQAAMVAEFDPTIGALNPEFGDGGAAAASPSDSYSATAITVSPDGSITAVGLPESGSLVTPVLLRFTATGQLDPKFNGGKVRKYNPCVFMSQGCYMFPNAVRVLRDKTVMFGGYAEFNSNSASMWAMRILPNGEPDPAFGSMVLGQAGLSRINLSSSSDAAYGLALQGERVVLGGAMAGGPDEDNYNFTLVRLADGSLFRDGLEAKP